MYIFCHPQPLQVWYSHVLSPCYESPMSAFDEHIKQCVVPMVWIQELRMFESLPDRSELRYIKIKRER